MLSPNANGTLAVGVLTATCLALAAWAAVRIRRSPFSAGQAVLYALNYVVVRVVWRTTVRGALRLPPGQGAVLVCNHRSSLDPSFIEMAVPRVVHWLVAKEYCGRPVLGWLLRLCEVIPTSRTGVDIAAAKTAIGYVGAGGLVGIFPEGHINTTDRLLLPGMLGVALVALKARAPIVPCYIRGAPYDGTPLGCLLMPAKVELRIGEPIDLSPYFGRERQREVLEEVTRLCLKGIAALAGRPDFEPELAVRPAHDGAKNRPVRRP